MSAASRRDSSATDVSRRDVGESGARRRAAGHALWMFDFGIA
jgi:hypothetical protein